MNPRVLDGEAFRHIHVLIQTAHQEVGEREIVSAMRCRIAKRVDVKRIVVSPPVAEFRELNGAMGRRSGLAVEADGMAVELQKLERNMYLA